MQRGIVYFLMFLLAAVAGLLLWLADYQPVEPAPHDATAALPGGGDVPKAAPVIVLPAGPPQPTGPRPASWNVHVEVISQERYVAPSPVRAEAQLAANGAALPTTLIAGAGAGFDASAAAVGSALAAIELGGSTLLRQIAIDAGEIARPTIGGLLVVAGAVRDEQGRPVIGAAVWFGEILADGSRREVLTVEEGLYSAQVPAGSGVPFVVRKPGYAAVWRPIQVFMPMPPCDAVLHPACTVDVQLVGEATSMADARVFVVPQAPVAGELTAWPFFAQVVADGVPLDERGRASIDELPRNGEVGILVRHPQAKLQSAVPVRLKGERVRSVVPLQFTSTCWTGRIVDPEALPLGGVALWSRARSGALAPGSSQRLLPPHLEETGTYGCRTRLDGTFQVAVSEAGVLSLRASGYAGRDVPAVQASRGGDLVLPRWLGGEVQFTLLPPAGGIAWSATTNLSGDLRADLAADASWRVSLPHAGCFQFVLTTRMGEAVVNTRTDSDVKVTGPIELAAPPATR